VNRPYIAPDVASSAQSCGEFVLGLLGEAIAERGRATIALSGGHTPQLLFDYLATVAFAWEKVEFFFVDERCVPPEHKDSNYRLANDHLFSHIRIPRRNIHRIEGELDPMEAARIYTETLIEFFGLREDELPVFDVMHLGMGPDGHTASLFPGDRLVEDRSGIASAVRAAKPPVERVTLLPGVLLLARRSVFLVDGADKRENIRRS
jgi:6-phosphogluconolactonase